jgi:putative copper resistance protein D
MMLFVSAAPLDAQLGESGHLSDRDHHGASAGGWEGSAQGVAYSEFNHHLAGLFVLLMGCAELSLSLRLPSRLWIRLLLPTAMLLGSVILLVWSDHEAWPIGSLSFAQTLSGHDPEIFQHKIYGFLLSLVGTVEALRRIGRVSDGLWSAPLPLFAIVGGLMLFGHSHGVHPLAGKIAMHHALMGTMAVTAGSTKLLSGWLRSLSHALSPAWEWLWASLIVLIGIQLLMYSE